MNKEERRIYWQNYIKKNPEYRKSQKEYRKQHPDYWKDFQKQHPNYWKEYLRKLKKWAVDKLGGRCSKCGLVSEYDCVYDFHHLEENSWIKEKRPSNMRTKELIKWRRADNIPDDVILLCANCHRIETSSDEMSEIFIKN